MKKNRVFSVLSFMLIISVMLGCAASSADSVQNEVSSRSSDNRDNAENVLNDIQSDASSGISGVRDNAENVFDYGIKVNIPTQWRSDSYAVTATESPELWYDLGYPLLYRVSCDYLGGEEPQMLFELTVFNAADWNELTLANGNNAPPFGIQIKMDDKFAYVAGTPQENPFEPETDAFNEFDAMYRYVTNDWTYDMARLFTITETDWGKFDMMRQDIRDFDAFFKLPDYEP